SRFGQNSTSRRKAAICIRGIMIFKSMESRYGTLWNREELILAFELYCRIPFQKTKSDNPEVIELARMIGRTPASVARKLGNFGAFDPALQNLNIKGLTHTSKMDREIWNEFHTDWNGLVWEANLLKKKFNIVPQFDETFRQPKGPSEKKRLTKQRVHQAFFRETVLSSYETTCCVTGLSIRECLIASHIVPWSKEEKFRTDPTNGLCLSATFDRLFDAGLMSITKDLIIRFSSLLMT
ncbi:HNH endonuclease, partial [bacterium]|nr:HNH endonuclease [bacterium]